ncbi:MAG: hypothetical protein HKL96_01805 [Phycisphaerales bacterium]|nr:hypothetical protein [Phycisphaerales bacterium]
MAEIDLSQAEADDLIAMPKVPTSEETYNYPLAGNLSIPLVSVNRRENFYLDIWRSGIVLAKGRYQSRARNVVILLRLDFGGSPHRNPNGTELPCPHLHIYREGYADKWAYAVPQNIFGNIEDAWQSLTDFMAYCGLVKEPRINRGLYT